jgi:uncharacterized protein (TIGR02246 family)
MSLTLLTTMTLLLTTANPEDGGVAGRPMSELIKELEEGQARLDKVINAGTKVDPEVAESTRQLKELISNIEKGQSKLDALLAPPPDEQLHAELRKVRDEMETALNARDLEGLVKHLDERVVFTTMNGDVVSGHQGVRDYFTKMLAGPNSRVKTVKAHFEATELSRLYGSTLATSFGTTADHYELVDGMAFDMKAQWSTTLRRDADGTWKILTFHYSANIFDNAVRDLELGLLKKLGAGIAVATLLLGLVLGRLTAKKKA